MTSRILTLAALAAAAVSSSARAQAPATSPAPAQAVPAQGTTTQTRTQIQAQPAQGAVIQQGAAVQQGNAGQQQPGQPGQNQGQGAVNDALFAQAAAASGLKEVTLAEMGIQRAKDSDLKKFSQQMFDEHNRLNQELTAVAAQRRIPIARSLDACAQFCAQSLSGLSGEEFDRCYAKAQLLLHMEAVAAFTAEAERGQDSELKAWAAKGLPKIKEHLKTIKPIAMKCIEQEKDNDKDDSKSNDKSDDKSSK